MPLKLLVVFMATHAFLFRNFEGVLDSLKFHGLNDADWRPFRRIQRLLYSESSE